MSTVTEQINSLTAKIDEFISQPQPSEGTMVQMDLSGTVLNDETLDDILVAKGFVRKEGKYGDYPMTLLYEEREGDIFHFEVYMDSPFSIYLQKHF